MNAFGSSVDSRLVVRLVDGSVAIDSLSSRATAAGTTSGVAAGKRRVGPVVTRNRAEITILQLSFLVGHGDVEILAGLFRDILSRSLLHRSGGRLFRRRFSFVTENSRGLIFTDHLGFYVGDVAMIETLRLTIMTWAHQFSESGHFVVDDVVFIPNKLCLFAVDGVSADTTGHSATCQGTDRDTHTHLSSQLRRDQGSHTAAQHSADGRTNRTTFPRAPGAKIYGFAGVYHDGRPVGVFFREVGPNGMVAVSERIAFNVDVGLLGFRGLVEMMNRFATDLFSANDRRLVGESFRLLTALNVQVTGLP